MTLLAVADAGATTPAGEPGSVAFVRNSPPAAGDVYLMGAGGGDQTPLTQSGDLSDQSPTFSASGRLIYFSHTSGTTADLHVINRDGSGQFPVTSTSEPVGEFQPDPSPDGTKLAFTSAVVAPGGGNSDVWVMNVDGSGAVNLTNTPMIQEADPSYSPDGRLIAFQRCGAGSTACEIWVMSADGSEPRPVTTGAGDSAPAFSRDGTKVAFVDCPTPTCDVHVVNLDGSGETNVSMLPGTDDLHPAFTADGTQIGFGSCAAMQCELLTVPVGGGPAAHLTNTPSPQAEFSPSFESVQRCGKRVATIVGDDGPDKIRGTKGKDVIDGNKGKNKIRARGGNDIICGRKGSKISCGKGNDKVVGKFKKAKGCERGKGLRRSSR